VSYQRALYRNRKALQDDDGIQVDVEQRAKVQQKNYPCGALNLNRIRLLNQIGFCWFSNSDDGSDCSSPPTDCSHPKQGSPTTAGTNKSGEEVVTRSATSRTKSTSNVNNNNASPHRTTTMPVASVRQQPQSHDTYSERRSSIAAHHHHGIAADGYAYLNLCPNPAPSQAAGTVVVTRSPVPAQFILTVPPTPVRQQPMLVRTILPSPSHCGTTSTSPNVVQNIVYVVSTPQPQEMAGIRRIW